MIAYASRTGTRRNLDMLRARGWRLLVSATGAWRHEGFPYAIDNGAWSAWNAKPVRRPLLDLRAFIGVVIALGAGADWVVAPDIVCGGMDSFRLSLKWLPWCLTHAPRALLAVQDGMTSDDIEPHLSSRVGIFVGGGDEFKERSVGRWAALARAHGTICHVGRVNTQRRIAICAAAGATSIDGTSATQFADSIPVLQRALAQTSFLIDNGENET